MLIHALLSLSLICVLCFFFHLTYPECLLLLKSFDFFVSPLILVSLLCMICAENLLSATSIQPKKKKRITKKAMLYLSSRRFSLAFNSFSMFYHVLHFKMKHLKNYCPLKKEYIPFDPPKKSSTFFEFGNSPSHLNEVLSTADSKICILSVFSSLLKTEKMQILPPQLVTHSLT